MSEPTTAPPDRSLKDEVSAALNDEGTEARDPNTISVAEARTAAQQRKSESRRTRVRLLFVTSDTDVLRPGTKTQQHYADVAQFVAEVHLMVLQPKHEGELVERPMKNVWVYHVAARGLLRQLLMARRVAKRHLRFNGVVQPDVIVSAEPYSAGVVGWLLTWILKRPWQVHMSDDITSLAWYTSEARNKRRKKLANFVLNRHPSVRTSTKQLAEITAQRYPKLEDVGELPHLFNLAAYRKPAEYDAHAEYPRYSFLLLAEGEFSADSALHDVFAATHQLLRNPRVCLLIRGTGTNKQLFIEKAKLLNIAEQVVFVDPAVDVVGLYQTVDTFVEAGTGTLAEERVLRAIAANTSVVTYESDFLRNIITDGESGFMCESGNSYQLGQHIRKLLNDSSLRHQFSMRAKRVVEEQLHEDVPTYYRAYRDTIAAVLVAHAERSPTTTKTPPPTDDTAVPADETTDSEQ